MASDVVVVGAGIVGAACAYYASRAGLTVTVLERRSVAAGASGSGEGNVLVSDKEPGPELDLALLSGTLWQDLAAEHGDAFEYEPKGGLVVAETGAHLDALRTLAQGQRSAGVVAVDVAPEDLGDREPQLRPDLAGGVFYPQDAQVQPMLAAARLLRASGAKVRTGVEVTGLTTTSSRVTAVRTADGEIPAARVINASGAWAGQLATALGGTPLPVQPRRGFVLVTEPLPLLIRHKVYTADYVADVASDAAGLATSAVVESTPAGTVLIGASRERVGFLRTLSVPVLRRLASQAISLFPFLANVAALRAYCGFRPYCPDHLPVIGPDPRCSGLFHASGHEGAGIGLAPATGYLLAQMLTGTPTTLDLSPFRPDRFEGAALP